MKEEKCWKMQDWIRMSLIFETGTNANDNCDADSGKREESKDIKNCSSLYRIIVASYVCTRVEVDNYASQSLHRKLGAVPNGLSEFLLHGEDLIRYQNENRYLIDDMITSENLRWILGSILLRFWDMS